MQNVAGIGKGFDAFIFDWDGTLSSLKLLRRLNERVNPNWRYKKMKSAGGDRYAAAQSSDGGIRRAEVLTMSFLFDISTVLMRPKMQYGAHEALNELREKDKKMAIFTNGARYRVMKELEHLGMEGYFKVVVSAQDLKALKPNPLGLKKVVALIKADKRRVLYTGDMVDDIVMAKRYGVKSCGVASGFDSYEKLKAARPDYLFRNMHEFWKAL